MTRGEIINARARAGQRLVRTREDWRKLRLLKATQALPFLLACEAYCVADIDYAIALGAELALP